VAKSGNPSKAPSDLRVVMEEILGFFASGYHNIFGMADGPPLHNPLAVAALLPNSKIFQDGGDKYIVTMATAGEQIVAEGGNLDGTRGQLGRTVVVPSKDGIGVRWMSMNFGRH
jgi:uridine nucleosidase